MWLPLALAAALACVPARAQERTKLITTPEERAFAAAVDEAEAALRPGPRAAPSIGSPRPVAATGWLDGATFLGPYGLKLDRSCLAFEGAAYPARPAKFVAAVEELHRAVQRCAATRVLPATVGLIYERMPRTTVVCDPGACEYKDKTVQAAACADHAKSTIYIKLQREYPWPSVLFHELMHLTEHVDNEDFAYHARPALYPLQDEVYFWEHHCFDQAALIGRMRTWVRARAGDRRDFRRLGLEVCAIPLRRQQKPGRPTFNEREIEAVCGSYADYLQMEANLVGQMWALMPQVFEGSGQAAPATPEELDAWTLRTCAMRYPEEARWNPVALAYACASHVKGLEGVAEKGRLVADGPGGYESFMDGAEASGARLRKTLTGVLAGCAKAPLAGSSLCAELTPESPLLRLMGRLILFWDPKTL